jgi:putative membrane protein
LLYHNLTEHVLTITAIAFPVITHALIAAFVVYVNQHITSDFNLPSSIVSPLFLRSVTCSHSQIPSLSIVVGLMLVFRNQTAYSRFWNGRLHVSTVTTAIRCLARQILVLTPAPAVPPALVSMTSEGYLDAPGTRTPLSLSESTPGNGDDVLTKPDELRTIETVKILIAMLYTIKNHLRAEWGVALSPGTSLTEDGQEDITADEYKDLLPHALKGYEQRGLGLTLQLSTFIEDFVQLGVKRKWIHNAASSSMLSELNALTSAYGNMEVIRLVPIPVAHLIHHKQTLALFCGILPFAMASEMDWWCVPLVAFVAFTLYGIEGIAQTYEDPFGVAKIDINLDDIVEDTRREVEVMLNAWQTQGSRGGLFRPHVPADGITSDASSEFFSHEGTARGGSPPNVESDETLLRVVVSDLSHEIERGRDSARERTLGGMGGGNGNKTPFIPLPEQSQSSNFRKDSAVSPGTLVQGRDYMSAATSAGRLEVAGNNGAGKRLSWNDSGVGV